MAKWRIGEYVIHYGILDLPKISSILGAYNMVSLGIDGWS